MNLRAKITATLRNAMEFENRAQVVAALRVLNDLRPLARGDMVRTVRDFDPAKSRAMLETLYGRPDDAHTGTNKRPRGARPFLVVADEANRLPNNKTRCRHCGEVLRQIGDLWVHGYNRRDCNPPGRGTTAEPSDHPPLAVPTHGLYEISVGDRLIARRTYGQTDDHFANIAELMTTAAERNSAPTEENTMAETGTQAAPSIRPALDPANNRPGAVMADIDAILEGGDYDRLTEFIEAHDLTEIRQLLDAAQLARREHNERAAAARDFEAHIRSILDNVTNWNAESKSATVSLSDAVKGVHR